MTHRTYAVIGGGALGGYYGALLQRSGHEVHFLLRSDFEHVRTKGMVIESINGNFTLPKVHAYREAAKMPRCDVVAVCLKATENHVLPGILPHVVKKDGIVLLMQNGLGAEEEIASIASSCRILGGLCFLCSNKIGPGHIRHLDYGHIRVAEYSADGKPCGISESVKNVVADFSKAGVETEADPDLLCARWKKMVWNIPYNGLSVVMNATTAELMADANTRKLAEKLMREVAAGAAGFGRTIDEQFIQGILGMTAKMHPYRTSMKIDFDERRPMETEAIYGNPLRAVQRVGVNMPQVEMLYHQLKFLESRNLKTKSQ